MHEKITFSNGRTENVYSVPQLLLVKLDRLPEFKIGPDDDIETVIEKGERLDATKNDLAILLAFKDVQVPSGWKFPKEALSKGLHPREGDEGRRVDYVENEILTTGKDAMVAQAAMFALTDEEVRAAGALFRPCRFAKVCPFSQSRRKH
jgi:hypothetical protein